ncbi:MAG TPA: carbohydrate ABC transporter permease [bacterium]|nr:carbohydrate ABC transporter permease [bacterium]
MTVPGAARSRATAVRATIAALRAAAVAAVLVFFLFPVYWLVTTAFKVPDDWFSMPPVFLPSRLTLVNFAGGAAGSMASLTTSIETITPYLRNSVAVAVVTAFVSTAIAALAAYAISRFRFGGIGFASWIVSIRMLPPIATALPLYVTFKVLGLLNTWTALILVYLVMTTPFSAWVLISFFNEIPRDLDEAAVVDGASTWGVFRLVALPLAVPGLAAMATLAFIQAWGEFLMALILTSSAAAQTLPIYLGRFITGFRIAWGPLAAAGLVTMVPVVVFSFIMLRYLIRGLTLGAVKY